MNPYTMPLAVLLLVSSALAGSTGPQVIVARVPHGGIQPQVVVDATDRVHLLYFKGHEMRGDLFYARSADGGETWSEPLGVNSQPESAIAVGTMRHAQMSLGRDGRVHVAWMGSDTAQPRAGKATPMLYARLNDAGDGFEPQRNVIQQHPGLDGGGSVAADADGNVYVAWHAPEKKDGHSEQDRRVWLARSTDDGRTFAPEIAVSPRGTGSCGCCGMRISASPAGTVHVLFRGASSPAQRDMYLLTSTDRGASFTACKVADWEIARCPASTAAFAHSVAGTVAAWESRDDVFFGLIDSSGRPTTNARLPGHAHRRHPAIARNHLGQILLAWSEGAGWQKGGSVAWQVFDEKAQRSDDSAGRRDDLPVWDLPAAFARADGTFVVLY